MISVVVPAYNEAALLGTAVRDMVDGLRALDAEFELHIVENGSTDGTPTIAARIAEAVPEVEVHSMRTANYGEALRTGLLASRGDVAVIFDVDFWDLQFLKEALDLLDASADPSGPVVVVGSKRAPARTTVAARRGVSAPPCSPASSAPGSGSRSRTPTG